MAGLFVTATDTGVGKTVVAAALVHALRAHGFDPGVCKPVQSGELASEPAGDAATLVRLARLELEPADVNVYAFAAPLAPLVAARRELLIGPSGSINDIEAQLKSATNAMSLLTGLYDRVSRVLAGRF